MTTSHGGRLFAIARERGWNWREILDFSASINPLGPSPAVFEAIQSAAREIVHYPESHPQDLTRVLAEAWNVDPDEILLGNGATELIHFLGAHFRDQAATLCIPAFSEFHRVFPHAEQVPANQPECWPTDGLTVITRPLNPTGELICYQEWLTRTSHPVIVDESFIEFAEVPSLTRFISSRPNLFVLRSLTKFYGIPGLRVGALVADANCVAPLKQLRDPWSLNTIAIRAACAAVADREHGGRSLEVVRTERAWLTRELQLLPGLTVASSAANFLFVRLPCAARKLTEFLEDRKLLIRDCTGWPGIEGGNGVRIAIRTRPENQQLIAAWREFACEL